MKAVYVLNIDEISTPIGFGICFNFKYCFFGINVIQFRYNCQQSAMITMQNVGLFINQAYSFMTI